MRLTFILSIDPVKELSFNAASYNQT